MSTPSLKRLFTIRETSQILELSIPHIRRLIYAGELRVVRCSDYGRIRIDGSEINRWITRNTRSYVATGRHRTRKAGDEE
jgi:excisionase family DNA binding protein